MTTATEDFERCDTHNTRFLLGAECCLCRNERTRAEAKRQAAEWAAKRDALNAAPRAIRTPADVARIRRYHRRFRIGLWGVTFFCLVSAWVMARIQRGG